MDDSDELESEEEDQQDKNANINNEEDRGAVSLNDILFQQGKNISDISGSNNDDDFDNERYLQEMMKNI